MVRTSQRAEPRSRRVTGLNRTPSIPALRHVSRTPVLVRAVRPSRSGLSSALPDTHR